MYNVQCTDTIEFIFKKDVPDGSAVTYASFVCDYRPLKSEPYRVRIVVGGDKLNYADDDASPATDMLENKLLINSTISDSDKGARFLSTDLKDFFLASPMERPEYMRVPLSKFPPDIIARYKLKEKVASDGYVYIKINKGMYSLKQAAILAHVQLTQFLTNAGYYPVKQYMGIWAHKTRPTKFCLCVDNFGVKYYSKDDANHLLNCLQQHYKISTDWNGRNYCGLTLDWNYDKQYVDISMEGYVKKQLDWYGHPKLNTAQYSPHKWVLRSYGTTPQLVQEDNTNPLDKDGIKWVQSIAGAFLYYRRAIDPTILPALTDIVSAQSNPTETTAKACRMLMDYLWTFPNAKIRYTKSDMILHVDLDAAYLVMPKARSRIAGHFFLGSIPPRPPAIPPSATTNGPILTVCKRLQNVVSSAAEAETGAAFYNSKEAIPIIRTLEALGHPQPPDGVPFKMDNAVTNGFIHSNIRQKRSKSWDMRYHWMRDKETQKLFRYYWARGEDNNADYFTKHHPPRIHQLQRSKYILKNHVLIEKLQLVV